MDRLACVEVPSLGLQLLLRREAGWRRQAAAVVAEDRPLAPVLAANARARRAGVRAGMRYATALALAPDLQAAPVSEDEIAAGVDLLAGLLRGSSPRVEPRREEPGLFWVDASGLETLYGSLELWAEAVRADLLAAGFRARVAVGFSRFGSYAAARGSGRAGVVVLVSAEEEHSAALAAPLAVLPLGADLQQRMADLGVRSVEAFLRLPAGGLLRRFGREARAAYGFASGGLALPIQAESPREPLVLTSRLAAAEADRSRLLACAAALLDRLLDELARHGELLSELHLHLGLEGGGELRESLKPAQPTRGRDLLLELLDLRLASLALASGVSRLSLAATAVETSDTQRELFAKRPRRDPEAAAAAFARLRAELGNDAVLHARLASEHLPERQYVWEAAAASGPARGAGSPARGAEPVLVRRILERPSALEGPPARSRLLGGPYALSGSWWNMAEADREYYFAEGAGGRIEWVYRDRRTSVWMLQGFVD